MILALRPLDDGDDLAQRAGKSSALSGLDSLNPLTVQTTEAHVRVAHENYSRTVPELCGRLDEDETSVSFRLYVPELGQSLTYRAPIQGGSA